MTSDLLIEQGRTIRDAVGCIDRSGRGIVLVVDRAGRLSGTVTDGDVRRALLAGVDLDAPLSALKRFRAAVAPVTAAVGTDSEALLQLMREHGVRQVPLVDQKSRVMGLVTLDELVPQGPLPLRAVVMAGGYGTRLRPLTDEVPKPMLPVGNRPLLEMTIQQLRDAGLTHVSLITHYKGKMINEHFGDGSQFGLKITCIQEGEPMGTAGALSMLEQSDAPMLVINGDILTRVDYRAMLQFHQEHQADMTVGVRLYELSVPYGVMQTRGVEVTGISEKPIVRHLINAGLYVLNPDVMRLIPKGQPFDMPELISLLLSCGRHVVSFPIREYWLDIGKVEDYQQALLDMEKREVASP
jgi:dTDP-glucose pyrophosphorylase